MIPLFFLTFHRAGGVLATSRAGVVDGWALALRAGWASSAGPPLTERARRAASRAEARAGRRRRAGASVAERARRAASRAEACVGRSRRAGGVDGAGSARREQGRGTCRAESAGPHRRSGLDAPRAGRRCVQGGVGERASSMERARRRTKAGIVDGGLVGGAGSTQEQGGRRWRAGWAELRRGSGGGTQAGRGAELRLEAERGRMGRRESDGANASGQA
jgi:hypothetical protein